MSPQPATTKKKPLAKQPARGKASGKPPTPGSAKAKTSKPKPQREPKPRPPVTTERLIWEGAELLIMYKTHAFGEASAHAHLEIRCLNSVSRPLPITDTGYRSHFLPRGSVEEAGGPGLYVRRWLDEAARSPHWKLTLARWRQLDLFG
jgi:hypothetical protein